MISAFSWERTIAVERHREGTTLQIAEDSHFVIPNAVCGVRNLSFLGFAAALCDVMREGTTLVVP